MGGGEAAKHFLLFALGVVVMFLLATVFEH